MRRDRAIDVAAPLGATSTAAAAAHVDVEALFEASVPT